MKFNIKLFLAHKIAKLAADKLGVMIASLVPSSCTSGPRWELKGVPSSSSSNNSSSSSNSNNINSKSSNSSSSSSSSSSSCSNNSCSVYHVQLTDQTRLFTNIKFVGSFCVDVADLKKRSEAVKNHLNMLKAGYLRGQEVNLGVSLQGIRVCSRDGGTLMNPILKRISYATCDPSSCLFSFLAREPGSPAHIQHCHTFRTTSPDQAEELNSVVGGVFRRAYAAQLQRQQERLRSSRSAENILEETCKLTHTIHSIRIAEVQCAGAQHSDWTGGRRPGSGQQRTIPTWEPRVGDCSESSVYHDLRPLRPETEPVLADDYSEVAPSPAGLYSRVLPAQGPEVYSELGTDSSGVSSGSGSPCPLPRHLDPVWEDLAGVPWYQGGMPRDVAMQVLAREPLGSFMVRESESVAGSLALSLRVPTAFQSDGIAHYIILHTQDGYKIKGFVKKHPSLSALITHHSVMQELLPVPLNLLRYNPAYPGPQHSEYQPLQDLARYLTQQPDH